MGQRVSGPLRAEAPFCSGAVASSRVQGVEEKLPCEDRGEPVPATALSSWEAPEVGANLEKTGGWRVWGQK